MKEEIKIGQVTMWAETIETPVIFDECYLTYKDRFTIIDVNDIFLVIRESENKNGMALREYKAFLDKNEALGYLQLYGIEKEQL